ncbi:MAG: substrate-binding domain-containing protein [Myxococcales bacterium]
MPPAGVVCAAPAPRPAGLLAAGSGPNLALVRAIAARYEAAHPGSRVIVPESIGTSGALKAVRTGAIDLGLASRPLTDAERGQGLVETPLARVAFAPTVRADVPLTQVSSDDLAVLFAGHPPPGWPQGLPLAPQLREARDTGSTLVVEKYPAVGKAIDEARRRERWLTRYSDQELRDALLNIEGAIGFLDAATPRLEHLPLHALAIDGIAPTAAEVRAGRFPLVRRLSFVTKGPPAGEAARFVAFARSDAVDELFALGELVPEEVR